MALKLGDFKKNNIWVTFGVILTVVLLLVLPDFFKNRDRAYVEKIQARSEGRPVTSRNRQVDKTSATSAAKTAPKADDSGPVESIKDSYSNFMSDLRGSSPRSTRKLQSFALQYGVTAEMDLDYINVPEEEQTWKRLKSRSIRKSIEIAQKALLKYSKNIRKTHPALAQEIDSFGFLLNSFYDAEVQGLDAVGVVRAIQDEEYELTRKVYGAGVPRIALVDWARISLSKLYGNTGLLEFKIENIPSFNPAFTVTKVKIYINKRDLNDTATQLKAYRLDLNGIFRGSDFKTMQIIQQGGFQRNIKPQRDAENPELFHIKIVNIDAAGIYRFIFTDQFGATVVRQYSFDPRYRSVTWNAEDAKSVIFNVPPQTGAGTQFLGDRLDYSGRVDSYYRYYRGEESFDFTTPRNDGFKNFGGGAGSNRF